MLRVPRGQDNKDTRYDYPVKVLKLALEKTATSPSEVTLKPAHAFMNLERLKLALQRRELIDVLWLPADKTLAAKFHLVPVPIRKGILGIRIPIIRQEDQQKLDKIQSLDELKRYKAGQGFDWADTAILRANKVPVQIGKLYDGLFGMLMKGRFDYFPRGLHEPWDEVAARKDQYPNMIIGSGWALHYPYADVFLVNQADKELAERIHTGLRRAIADGSFDALFRQEYSEVLKKAHLETRKIFSLKNPFLPKELNPNDAALWHFSAPSADGSNQPTNQ